MSENKYIERVLIKLRREYGKDEYVKTLLKQISELEKEKGILTSERDEAIYNLEQTLKLPNDVKSRIGQRAYYRNQVDQVKAYKTKNKQLKIENEKLFHQLALKNQD